MMKDSPEGQTQYCQNCDELAAQNQQLRAALEDCQPAIENRYGCLSAINLRAQKAIALPNTAAAILRQRDARTKAEMLKMLADGQDAFDEGTGLLPFQMRKMAEELEENNG